MTSNRCVMEALLRPAVELNTAVVAGMAAWICTRVPWALGLSPPVSEVLAIGFMLLSLVRLREGCHVLRYRRNLRRLPYYVMASRAIPVSRHRLFLGKGFRWTQKHTQRLQDTRRAEVASYVQPAWLYRVARRLEQRCENGLPVMGRLLSTNTPFNPVRPLPPVGGKAVLHGIEPEEAPVTLALAERTGHTLVMGATRVGKTRLAELLIAQDIRRGETTIVFDPKGDADLFRRVWAEAHRAGRENVLTIFHLGWQSLSARYNAVGRFDRISEVASRVTGQLPGEGNSAAFREFAWRFVNIIARALVALGQRPDYTHIMRYVSNISELYLLYAQKAIQTQCPALLQAIANDLAILAAKDVPRNLQGQVEAVRIWATELALSSPRGKSLYDPILEGLRSAVRYDRTYFDKIVASLLPLLEKLTTGSTASLLSPDYGDMEDGRPILDWELVIRKRGVVYIGLDALSDSEVATAVGNSMFADLVSFAGHIYKHGTGAGLPKTRAGTCPVNLHCDEFNELMGDEFIPLINKGGGAGIQVTAYTQTVSDIEARLGSVAKTAQVTGNFGTLIMLRVHDIKTAELLTAQLPQVEIYTKTLESGHADIADPEQRQDFSARTQDRVMAVKMPLLEPADVVSLPKGQAFALFDGGQLWKIRMPLPAEDVEDRMMPGDLAAVVAQMQRHYHPGESWWRGTADPETRSNTGDTNDCGAP